jgi:hypothetical protein
MNMGKTKSLFQNGMQPFIATEQSTFKRAALPKISYSPSKNKK